MAIVRGKFINKTSDVKRTKRLNKIVWHREFFGMGTADLLKGTRKKKYKSSKFWGWNLR